MRSSQIQSSIHMQQWTNGLHCRFQMQQSNDTSKTKPVTDVKLLKYGILKFEEFITLNVSTERDE